MPEEHEQMMMREKTEGREEGEEEGKRSEREKMSESVRSSRVLDSWENLEERERKGALLSPFSRARERTHGEEKEH